MVTADTVNCSLSALTDLRYRYRNRKARVCWDLPHNLLWIAMHPALSNRALNTHQHFPKKTEQLPLLLQLSILILQYDCSACFRNISVAAHLLQMVA